MLKKASCGSLTDRSPTRLRRGLGTMRQRHRSTDRRQGLINQRRVHSPKRTRSFLISPSFSSAEGSTSPSVTLQLVELYLEPSKTQYYLGNKTIASPKQNNPPDAEPPWSRPDPLENSPPKLPKPPPTAFPSQTLYAPTRFFL